MGWTGRRSGGEDNSPTPGRQPGHNPVAARRPVHRSMRYQSVLTIPIELRRGARQPLYQQIAGQIETAAGEGRLVSGTALPSSRTLAGLLGVSRGVVAAAYDLLSARGRLAGRAGSGSYLVGPAAGPGEPSAARAPELVDLRPGGPGVDVFPVPAWRAAWRRASFRPPPAHPPPALGLPELRRAIAGHLRETRGLALAGCDLVVTAGTAPGLRAVLQALRLAGPQVAVEEPGPPALRRAVSPGLGDPSLLPVDRAGARVADLPPSCRAVVVSPDGHEPLGHIMSAERRAEAAAWAAETGGWLVEVACDTVFRPDAYRLPRLSTLAGGSTVVVGGFGTLLAPGIGLGYAVVPAALARRLARLVAGRGEQPPHILQLAIAELLTSGAVTRLMHQLGRAYRRKRRLVETALHPVARLAGLGAAGSAVLYLPGEQDGRYAARELHRRGVRVRALAAYHCPDRLPQPARSGLVIGYGHLPDPALRAGLAALARELAALA